ncbi:MAG TPA: hypothetical protein VFL83_09780 [Anaeromyxobacter sp.]|nr:hypothetical protein [Anaeromyxobacter sp.]
MGERARIYRTRLPLRIAVVLAACVWTAALVLLLRLPGSGAGLLLGAAALVLFFAAAGVVYGRTSITVTGEGIVAASAFRRRPIAWDDILQVVVRDGLGGREYAVVTRRGLVHFTSLFARHRELFEALLEGAGLRARLA